MSPVLITLHHALDNFQGDNAYRARAAFKGMTQEQMQEQHGASGLTRAQVLAGHEEHEREVEAARDYLKTLK